jgi:hypothetical protein
MKFKQPSIIDSPTTTIINNNNKQKNFDENYLKLLNLKTINNKFNLKLKLNSFSHHNFKYYFIE